MRLHLLGHLRFRDRLVEFRDLLGLAVAFAELALDRRHLLAQDRLALAFVENGLGLPADLLGEPQHLDALRQEPRDLVHAHIEVDRLQDLLLIRGRDIHIGGGQIRQRASRLRALHGPDQLAWHLRQKLQRLDGLLAQQHGARFDLLAFNLGLGDALDFGRERRPLSHEIEHAETLDTLHDHMMAAIGRGQIARDIGDRADAVHVGAVGLRGLAVALHEDADLPLLAHRLLHSRDRDRPPDRDREEHAGKEHRIAHRQNEERILVRPGRGRAFTGLRPGGEGLNGIGNIHGAAPYSDGVFCRLMSKQPLTA